MAIVEKKGGKLPVYKGDWSELYNDGHGYMVKNRVTIFGSELESLIDNNTYVPATRDEQTGVVTFEEHWKVISNGSQAYAAALAATNKMAELEEEWDDQDQRMDQMQATINAKQLEVGAVQTDEVPTENSGNHMTSGDIYQTLKNSTKGFVDDEPTAESQNLVKSGGVYEEVSQLGQKLSIYGIPQNGYIDNTYKWKGLNDSLRKYSIIKLPFLLSGSSYSIKGNSEGLSVVAFLSAYNPVEDASADVLDYKVIQSGQTITGIIPASATYIYVLAISRPQNRLPQEFLIDGADIANTPAIGLSGFGVRASIKKIADNLANNLSFRLWSLGEKPNVDSENNTLTFLSATTISIGTDSYTIPANTIVDLAASGTAYSTIVFNKSTSQFQTIGRAVSFDITADDILIGFAVTTSSNKTKKRFYFPFSYTIDGNDVETLSENIETLSENIDALSENIDALSENIEYLTKSYYGQGYINAGNWADIGSGYRYYYCIPIFVKDDSTFEIQYNATAYSVLYFLSENNPVSGQSAGAVSSQMGGVNTTITGNVPSGAKYLYMLAESGAGDFRMPQKVIIDGIDYLKSIKESLANLSYNINNQILGSSISALNPEASVKTRLNNLKIGYVEYGQSVNYPPVVSLLHFSDLHNNNVNLLRISEFLTKYAENIDNVIQTGDLVGNVITDKVPASWASVGADWLSVIGNHDATIRENDLWVTVPAKDSYDEIIAPYVANWGVVQPAGAGQNDYYPCYYYKDYAESNLRLVVLDNMQSLNGGPTHWDSIQKAWFESVLADAITNNLSVVVAVHYPPFFMTPDISNPFDSISVRPTNIPSWFVNPEIPNAVKDFIDNGGTFVCYLCGHTHSDYFGVAQNENWANQLAIGVASASYIAGAGIYGDSDRAIGTKGQDCFNIIGIDTQSKTIKIVRIGLEYDKYMRRKNVLCWDYGNNQLVYVD